MKLVIFGSTGSVGRQLVVQALAMGHRVTGYTRNPGKIKDVQHPNLCVLQGDVLDRNSVENAVRDQEAVLLTLGDGSKGKVRSEGTRLIVEAMEKMGVKRLVCQTTLGAGESKGNLNFFWKYIMFGLVLRKAFLDHEEQERHVMRSRLDWTIVRPAAFIDGKATGNFRHGFAHAERDLSLKISRADVAMFMLTQLTTDRYLRKAPGLSY